MLKKCSFNGWVCFWSHSFIRFPSFPAFCMQSALKHVLTLQLSKRMFFEGTIGLLCCLLFLCTPPNPPQWLLLVLQRIFPLLRLHFFFLSSPLLLVNSHGLSIWADSLKVSQCSLVESGRLSICISRMFALTNGSQLLTFVSLGDTPIGLSLLVKCLNCSGL